ncbi:MAG: tRNA pseudouridine(38-40) synthase TruA [Clostridia bacterium]|nr:tRNA pseudouridine(38-40) synthase TruA [Clostridia bacterium]
MKFLLYISYDGSGYVGYQTQKNGRSVQEELTRAASDLFGVRCDVTGCSRTDSGVHANMFCATVEPHGGGEFATSITADKIPFAMNTRLPDSISVWQATEVEDSFHVRYSVVSKEYVYRIYNSPVRDPFEVSRSWQVPKPIDGKGLEAMKTALASMVGKRDFAACMAAGSKVTSTVRTVFEADVKSDGKVITVRIRADGFLYNMVRIIVGTLLDVAYGKISPDSIGERLDSLDRRKMGRTAPPDGLYLNRVFYE